MRFTPLNYVMNYIKLGQINEISINLSVHAYKITTMSSQHAMAQQIQTFIESKYSN